MPKVIIFDFDGVILESTDIKTDAFSELFYKYGVLKDSFIQYHRNNMGISRFVKFKYFYEEILGVEYTDQIGERLSEQFSQIVVKKIIAAPFVKGAKEFLECNKDKYNLFIATGTPETEIKHILKEKEIDCYFRDVFGSPKTKEQIIREIMRDYSLYEDEIVFVGDAISDYKAAKAADIAFIGREVENEGNIFPEGTNIIFSLSELENALKNL